MRSAVLAVSCKCIPVLLKFIDRNMLMKTILILVVALISVCQSASRNLVTLNEETWTNILDGEWMVEL